MEEAGIEPNQLQTINDIAAALCVSKTTVSRAISGKGRIGKETREKVLSYIEAHGYRPNLIAKSLAESRTFNIAVVIPADADVHEIPFFQVCLYSITEAVNARDYDVVVSVTSAGNIAGLRRLVKNRKVDGVILTRPLSDDKAVAFLKTAGLPFAVIGNCGDELVAQVDSDHDAGCREATLYALSHRAGPVILLAGNPDHQVNKDRFAGFCRALSESGAGAERASVVWNAGSKSGIERKMRNAMEASPGTLLCMDDVIASRSLSWLHRHGYSIPRDVSLMSFHDSAAMEDHIPSITALHVNIHDLGCAAANNLIDAANGRETAKKILVPYRLIIRDSSRI